MMKMMAAATPDAEPAITGIKLGSTKERQQMSNICIADGYSLYHFNRI
jgi:hypothetical protein